MTERVHVFVGVPLSESVHSEFFKTFWPAQLLLPEEGAVSVEVAKWGNTVNNRNDLVKSCLRGDYTHLFFMDSDMSFPESTLSRLLYHDKDIIGGFYTTKVEPYNSTCFVDSPNDGYNYRTYNPQDGEHLKEVAAIGTGCMLIKRQVLEAMKWPWFYYKPNEVKQTFATEDVAFCEDARGKGFKVWCDFNIKCGHVGHMLVQPLMIDGLSKVRLSAV